MNPATRKQYLKALGIDGFVLRGAEPAVAEPVAPPAVALEARESAPPPLAVREPAPRITPPPAARIPVTPPSVTPQASPAIASSPAVEVPQDWAGLREMVRDCQRCKLCAARTQSVFGVGVENAPLMVVGEGPGADEDAKGEPFVGRAGQLLDEMLKSIGRSRRDNVFIANVVKCRPPGNRDPEVDEVEACRPYLEQQIKLVKPKLIIGLGRIAAQRLLQRDSPLSRLRGPLYHYGAEQTPLLITYHPAYLLRSPREKAKSWDDLKKAHRFLAKQP